MTTPDETPADRDRWITMTLMGLWETMTVADRYALGLPPNREELTQRLAAWQLRRTMQTTVDGLLRDLAPKPNGGSDAE